MNIIEEKIDEIIKLLLDAERNCENSRSIFAEIKNKLLVIEQNYDKLLRDYTDLQNAHNSINRLNSDELIRRSQELEELKELLRNLNQEYIKLNDDLTNKKNKNDNFIKTSVLSHIKGLIEKLICFKNHVSDFKSKLSNNNQKKKDIFVEITRKKNDFNNCVTELRKRRNDLIQLENDRNSFFNEQQLYIQNYEQYLNEKANFVAGRDDQLSNLQNTLNGSLANHAQNVKKQIDQHFDNLKNSLNIADGNFTNIQQELNKCDSEIKNCEALIETIENYDSNSENFRWNNNYLLNFLFILFSGYILNLSFFIFINFLANFF